MNLDKESVQDNGSQYSNKRIRSNKLEPNNEYAMTIKVFVFLLSYKSFIRATNIAL